MSLPLTAGGLRSSQTSSSARRACATRGRCEASAGTSTSQDRKLRTYPELQPGGHGRCRLVVFGLEVGGRFDGQALALLRRLARARARDRAPWAREAAGAALTRRWAALAALAAVRAHAQSLLELPVRRCGLATPATAPSCRWASSLRRRRSGVGWGRDLAAHGKK